MKLFQSTSESGKAIKVVKLETEAEEIIYISKRCNKDVHDLFERLLHQVGAHGGDAEVDFYLREDEDFERTLTLDGTKYEFEERK